MFSAALYARVRTLLVHIAHEIAGAARIRHSLRPLFSRAKLNNSSGISCRENADTHSTVIARPSAQLRTGGGRPSIPETTMIESRSRSVLDPPLSRRMTAEMAEGAERDRLWRAPGRSTTGGGERRTPKKSH